MNSKDSNTPPFHVSQKVVCIKDAGIIKKGTIVTVYDIFNCTCGSWHVLISEYPFSWKKFSRTCSICKKDNNHVTERYYSRLSEYFRPIAPRHEDVDIDAEIIDQAKDLIKVKETSAPILKPIENLINNH